MPMLSLASGRESVLSTQYSVLSTQYSVLSTQYSVLGAQFSPSAVGPQSSTDRFGVSASGFGLEILPSSFPAIADLNPRMPSPIPLPSSGNFLGPKTSSAMPKTTSMCMG